MRNGPNRNWGSGLGWAIAEVLLGPIIAIRGKRKIPIVADIMITWSFNAWVWSLSLYALQCWYWSTAIIIIETWQLLLTPGTWIIIIPSHQLHYNPCNCMHDIPTDPLPGSVNTKINDHVQWKGMNWGDELFSWFITFKLIFNQTN